MKEKKLKEVTVTAEAPLRPIVPISPAMRMHHKVTAAYFVEAPMGPNGISGNVSISTTKLKGLSMEVGPLGLYCKLDKKTILVPMANIKDLLLDDQGE